MKVLIVDDEAPARERLQRIMEQLEGYSVCGQASSGEEALAVTEACQPDVLLMDIRMPGMDGLEAARHLLVLDQPPAIIFTTAYSEHAVDAFETHAVDYLLKPVRQERLLEALENAGRLSRIQAAALQSAGENPGGRQRICARIRGSLQLIPVNEIRYFQADQKYVTVCTPDTRVLIEESLKSLEEEFAERFIRIHRNALIAKDYLAGLEKDADGCATVSLLGIGEQLEVSRRHLAEVRRLVKALQS